jgi:prepilin-type N-terminal cleavage/methylation domain-containing protein
MSRRGFTIIEMLWVLVLLAMVAAMTERVFSQAMRGIRDQQLRQWHDATEQSLNDHLRADVWTSTEAHASESELRLRQPAGEITYRIEPQCITRLAPGELEMRWEQPEQGSFGVAGRLVTLGNPAHADAARVFVAPMIGQGGRP